METQILSDLGFTNAEIKVYLSLLELGSSSAGQIIERSQLQSSVVHTTLNRLIEKGFISFVKQGQRKHYSATNPKHISEYIDTKKEEFKKLLPKLLEKQKSAKTKSEVTTFRGIKGIKELLYELLEEGGNEYNTFGATKDSLIMGDTFWINYHKKRSSKGIKAKLLFNDSLKNWVKKYKAQKAEYRFTKTGFEPLTETIIRKDKIGMIIWTQKPIGILIRNKVAADSYYEFWKVLWDSSK